MVEPKRRSDNTLLLDAALEHPYWLLRGGVRLVMWNHHYLDIYGFPAHRIRKGMTLAAVVRPSAELGHHPGQSAAEFLAAYRKALLDNRGGVRAKMREFVAGGRWLETAHVFSPGLGWVVTHEDITEEAAAAEIALRRQSALEQENIRLDAAVNNISQGLSMYDAAGRLVICNAPYARIYKLPDALLQPGTPLDDILANLFDRGMTAADTREDYTRWRRNLIARAERGKSVLKLHGRTILMQHHPTGRRWVSTHEDITELRKRKRASSTSPATTR